MNSTFTPSHRGGSGPPLVLLHGFIDTWRTWELVLPALERHHDVLAPTLAGHAGGPPLYGEIRDSVLTQSWSLDAESITCPVRIVWGTGDALLPLEWAATRFRNEWLPHADWIELDGVGHCPQLDIPVETAELILGCTR